MSVLGPAVAAAATSDQWHGFICSNRIANAAAAAAAAAATTTTTTTTTTTSRPPLEQIGIKRKRQREREAAAPFLPFRQSY